MRVMRLFTFLGVATLLLFLVSNFGFAGVTGKITGKVLDKETGEALPGANIIVDGTMMGSAADIEGNYTILNVPPGNYTLIASMIGYSSTKVKDVRVSIDLTTTVNFELSSEVLVGEVVSIVAERPLIQKDVTASTKIASQEQIQAIPVATVQGALAVAPGASSSGRNMHMRGGRSGEIQYVVDGISVEDVLVGGYALNVGREAVAEMQLISGGFNAEYGNAQSGVVLLTTRDGQSDQYRGKILYKTDDFGGSGLGENSENYDLVEASIGGPEPITTYLLPQLGLKIPGQMTFFLQADETMDDGRGNIRYLTSDKYKNPTLLNDWFGLGGKRDAVTNTSNFKLTYNISPNHKLSFGFRGSNEKINGHTFSRIYNNPAGGDEFANLTELVQYGQSLGLDDGMDNDGDGRIDEEVFDGIDNDGDGVIDEYDAKFVDPASVGVIQGTLQGWDFSWGIDNDNDGRIDEETINGIDDDGDGRIDEDTMAPFSVNGFDTYRRYDRNNTMFSLNWTHTLSSKTFYEFRLSRFKSDRPILPRKGINRNTAGDIDELENWVADYEVAQAEVERVRAEREREIEDTGSSDIVVPDIRDLIEPGWAFGYPSEPYDDINEDGRYTPDEDTFEDWNGNGLWDHNNPQGLSLWFEGENHPLRGYKYQDYTQLFWRWRQIVYTAKFDLTSQVNQNHQLKSGFEANYYDLYNNLRQYLTPYNGSGLFPNYYHIFSHAVAAYVQDKMEFKSAIVNLGLRFEYFNPGDQVKDEKTDNPNIPGYDLLTAGANRSPENSYSLLPRFGISFPVTDKMVFHFFYGHFFQRPDLDDVYNTVNQPINSSQSIVGNPGLDPEETISYEVGVRQQFTTNTMLSITGFFKDIDNLTQIGRVEDNKGNVFRTYLNDTYGTVRGIEMVLNQRTGRHLSGEASYTYQVATTTHSTARGTYNNENAFANLPGKEYPADWDQRHTFTLNVDYHFGENEGPALMGIHPLENWNLNILHTSKSGMPYTPTAANGSDILTEINTKRTPAVHSTDLRMRKYFNFYGDTRLGVILDVFNIFDRKNVVPIDEYSISVDRYRDRIGYSNGTPPTRIKNYGGFANAIADPYAWEIGRRLRLGFSVEF